MHHLNTRRVLASGDYATLRVFRVWKQMLEVFQALAPNNKFHRCISNAETIEAYKNLIWIFHGFTWVGT